MTLSLDDNSPAGYTVTANFSFDTPAAVFLTEQQVQSVAPDLGPLTLHVDGYRRVLRQRLAFAGGPYCFTCSSDPPPANSSWATYALANSLASPTATAISPGWHWLWLTMPVGGVTVTSNRVAYYRPFPAPHLTWIVSGSTLRMTITSPVFRLASAKRPVLVWVAAQHRNGAHWGVYPVVEGGAQVTLRAPRSRITLNVPLRAGTGVYGLQWQVKPVRSNDTRFTPFGGEHYVRVAG